MRERIEYLDQLLLGEYGDQPQPPCREPLDELIFTILSQNTSRKNYERGFKDLKARFPTWEQALAAGQEEIEEAIKSGGLAKVKSTRILGILRQLKGERGELSLAFLHNLPLDEAYDYLLRYKGVGPKTAACVLLFACGMSAFPVDTHVHRLSLRLGLVPKGSDAVATQELLQKVVPSELAHRFHVNLVNHGREVCKAQKPRCEACVLGPECRWQIEGEGS